MRIWDNELLAAENVNVVRSGLLSWIDFQDSVSVTSSIAQGAITGTIVDRVSGNTAEIRSETGSNHNKIWFGQTGKFLVLHPTNASTYTKAIILPESVTGCKALEFVYRNAGEGNKAQQYFANRTAYNILSNQNQLYIFSNSYSVTNSLIGGADPVHVYVQIDAFNKGSLYLNGTLVKSNVSAGASTFDSTRNLMIMGLKGTTETQSCMIGSIRLYNRTLTQDELRQNIQYEVKKGRLTV